MKTKRMLNLIKFSPVALALSACALPLEEHGGAAPKPEPSDFTFMAAGAAINTTGILLKAPWYVRIAADAAAVYVLRFPKWGGRYEGVALTLPFGAYFPEVYAFIRYGKKHPSHPDCWLTRGPDTTVAQPITIAPQKGQVWSNECVTWDEVRRLRHED
jgi:hypothetical protein